MAQFHVFLLTLCMGASFAVLHSGNATASSSVSELDSDASDSMAVGYRYTEAARKVLSAPASPSPTPAPSHAHQQQQQEQPGYSYQAPVSSYATYSSDGYPLYQRSSQTPALAAGLHDERLEHPPANAPTFFLPPASRAKDEQNKADGYRTQTFFVPRQRPQATAESVPQPQGGKTQIKGYSYAQPQAPLAVSHEAPSQASQQQIPSASGYAEQLQGFENQGPSAVGYEARSQAAQQQFPSAPGCTEHLQSFQPQAPSASGYAEQSQAFSSEAPSAVGYSEQPEAYQPRAPSADHYAEQPQVFKQQAPTAEGYSYQPHAAQPQATAAADAHAQDLTLRTPSRAASTHPLQFFKPNFPQIAAENNDASAVASQGQIANAQQAARSHQSQAAEPQAQAEYANFYSSLVGHYPQQEASQGQAVTDNGYRYHNAALHAAKTTQSDGSLFEQGFFPSSAKHAATYQTKQPQFAYAQQYRPVPTASEAQDFQPQGGIPRQPLASSNQQPSSAIEAPYHTQARQEFSSVNSYPQQQQQQQLLRSNAYALTSQPAANFLFRTGEAYAAPHPTAAGHFGAQSLAIPAAAHLPASAHVVPPTATATEHARHAAGHKGNFVHANNKPTAIENVGPATTQKHSEQATTASVGPYSSSTGGFEYLQMPSHSYQLPSYVTMLSEAPASAQPEATTPFFPITEAQASYQHIVRRPHAFYGAPFERTATAASTAQASAGAQTKAHTYLPPSAQQETAFKK